MVFRSIALALPGVVLLVCSAASTAQSAVLSDAQIGAQSRQRAAQLNSELRGLLTKRLPEIRDLYAELDRFVDALDEPETLATPEPGLRSWGEAEEDAFQGQVDIAFDEARDRLQAIYDSTLAEGDARGEALSAKRSPLDAGQTGDGMIDLALTSFEETMRGAVGLARLKNMRQEYRQRGTEIVQAFTSFGSDDAQEMLDGRLLLFVGGDERESPRCMIAYRNDSGANIRGYRIAQVMRHRVMRGNAIVHDLGWRPLPGSSPGYPALTAKDNYLVAGAVEPFMSTDASGYDGLRDRRVVVDIQSGVVSPTGQLLGSVDWRLEFTVSARGDLAWQQSDRRAVFDPHGAEIKRVLLGGR